MINLCTNLDVMFHIAVYAYRCNHYRCNASPSPSLARGWGGGGIPPTSVCGLCSILLSRNLAKFQKCQNVAKKNFGTFVI